MTITRTTCILQHINFAKVSGPNQSKKMNTYLSLVVKELNELVTTGNNTYTATWHCMYSYTTLTETIYIHCFYTLAEVYYVQMDVLLRISLFDVYFWMSSGTFLASAVWLTALTIQVLQGAWNVRTLHIWPYLHNLKTQAPLSESSTFRHS